MTGRPDGFIETDSPEAAAWIERMRTPPERMEAEIRPLIDGLDGGGGTYNCCGCSTYDTILDHAIALARGEEFDPSA